MWKLAEKIIGLGGWGCWMLLVQSHITASDSFHTRLRTADHKEAYRICGGEESFKGPTAVNHTGGKVRVVLNRQHNGLGNQLFQYVFSRLVGESFGFHWHSTLIKPEEAPYNRNKHPPNSKEGWAVFARLFANTSLAVGSHGETQDVAVCQCYKFACELRFLTIVTTGCKRPKGMCQ